MAWRKGDKTLGTSDKFTMRCQGTVAELVIHDLVLADAGDYTCSCGEQETTAALKVNGKNQKEGNASEIRDGFQTVFWVFKSVGVSGLKVQLCF